MPRSESEDVVGHWAKLIDEFSTSGRDFYASLEEALSRRRIPEFQTTRVTYSEGGVFDADREYLQISRERLIFAVCAAPFGRGFFFSWWATKRRPQAVLVHLLLMAMLALVLTLTLTMILPPRFGLLRLGAAVPIAGGLTLWLAMLAARSGWYGPEDALLSLPILGPWYQQVFAPPSFYRRDTMIMFQSAVHAAMLEVIDGLTTKKGIRCLTADERKPVFHGLL